METANADDLLQFQDYSNTSTSSSTPAQINVNSPIHSNNGASGGGSSGQRQRGDPLADLIYDMNNSAQILSGNSGGSGGAASGSFDDSATTGGGGKVSFLTIEYYQQFFNVDTYMVLERIANSMIPKRAPGNYLRMVIGENPDLYGPFWITVTLIFSIAISGNIASYLQHASDVYYWHYNFHLVSYASTCIFLYVNVLPIVLWALFKYSLKPNPEDSMETESANYTPTLLSLMCIYGYSLAIYVPVSILWVIQISFLQWLLVITAALLSGVVLITVLAPALRNSNLSMFLIIGILSAHFLLAAGFMLYFFHVPSNTGGGNGPIAKTNVAKPAAAALKAVTQSALNLVVENLSGASNNTALNRKI